MAENNATVTTPETATVTALVTLTVAPKQGQSPDEAAAEMLVLFQEYLTVPDNTFLTDYGISAATLAEFQAGKLDTSPVWGGYEGPFVLEATVAAVVSP